MNTMPVWEEVSLDMRRIVTIQKGDRRLVMKLVPAAVDLLASMQPDPAARRGPVFWYGNPAVGCTCPTCTVVLRNPDGTTRREANPRWYGKPIQGFQRAYETARRNAGLEHVRFHDLRHTFASWMLASGASLKETQEAMNHADIASTARYGHLEERQVLETMDRATRGLEPGWNEWRNNKGSAA